MIQKIVFVTIICLMGTVAVSADLPDSSKLPRMPDAYRNNDYKDLTKRNPYGMSVYDVAEREAEEALFRFIRLKRTSFHEGPLFSA